MSAIVYGNKIRILIRLLGETHYSYLDIPVPGHHSYQVHSGTWSLLLLVPPVPGNHFYQVPPVPGNPSYWVPQVPGHPSYQVPPVPSNPSNQVPPSPWYLVTSLTWYDPIVHRYTYLDWVYQVPVNHIGNGAGLWFTHFPEVTRTQTNLDIA